LLLAITAWIGFMLYSYWYSSLNRQPSGQLQIGNMLPDFELKDVAGQAVDSSHQTARVIRADGSGIPTIMAFWFAWYAFHPETDVFETS